MIGRRVCGAAFTAFLAATSFAAEPWTAEQDHADMMHQLGITQLRPGANGDPIAPDAANYDPGKANPFPVWPELLKMTDGRPVTTAAMWRQQRRPELIRLFERDVYGRIPPGVPSVTWRIDTTDHEYFGGGPVVAEQLVGHVDDRATPAIAVDIRVTLLLPANAKAAVPLLVMFGPARYPSPTQPSATEAARLDGALKATLIARDPSFASIFAAHPGFEFVKPGGFFSPPPDDDRVTKLIAAGWGVALLDTASIQPDTGAGLREGIIGLVNKGAPRTPEQWGALRAWGWGASRLLDYLGTRTEVDVSHVGIEGVSRWGKAALVTAAFDERFAMVLIGSSGEGGVKPHRRNFGEAVENLTGTGGYHWMAGNFLQYGTERGRLGRKTAADLPVDAHELLALVAPRLAFVSYGVPEKGDANWLDQQGSYMATIAAGRAWTLLGAHDLGRGHDYSTAMLPPQGTDLLDGELAWRQHEGGHTDAPNMNHFIAWADHKIGHAPSR
ncbi:glucuronyl esterase domain-containing protein [Sphingomonas sp. Tas61C01]|uniref:glucuronyl esterase domain-containing protein n=1 Tax=Sphingomonas sp. Tas61C01 TaxID=3458297 RepID=UPI00403E9214